MNKLLLLLLLLLLENGKEKYLVCPLTWTFDRSELKKTINY